MSAVGWYLCGLATGFAIGIALVGLFLSVIWNDITRIVRYER